MAQGLDLKSWRGDKSPSMGSKSGETVKKTRGVGSRRIFPPQFKLQVLDSYRNDVDCRGNQRATARKYNIHRRQIQKWLQCEQNLRTTVEESARSETSECRPRKKTESEPESTLNQSATAPARPSDAGRSSEGRQESGEDSPKESVLEAQNLKRVAQKLYPSLQGIPCSREEKVMHPSDGQKFYRGDVFCSFRLPPAPADVRDDNFNKVGRTDDDGPLNLKSKVRSEVLPEEFLASNHGGPLPDDDSDKLSVADAEELASESSSSGENLGGQKLSVSNAVLQCLVQKYTDDVGGREFYARHAEREELLCSQSASCAESSCLSDARVPENLDSVPSSAKRNLDEGEEPGSTASDLNLTTDGYGPDTRRKKPKREILSRFDYSKSFSPKRKWMKESMQEMLEDAEHIAQDPCPALPFKQRVKMNLKALPEECHRRPVVSSNFTIERLCSSDAATRESRFEGSDVRPRGSSSGASTPDAHPDFVSFRLEPERTFGSFAFREDVLDVPLKEERLSDGEDEDVDVLSTTPVEKKSFEFAGYNFGKRRSFSVQFKLTVLDAFYNDKDCNKNQRATARKFNINRRQVQKWLSQESDLRSEGSLKNGKYLQRQRLGGDVREAEPCAGCPQHCLRKKDLEEPFDKTIQVNVKHCSDNECLSRRDAFHPDDSDARFSADGIHFYGRSFFRSDLKTNFYHNYLLPENNNMIYHESLLGWPNLTTSALPVPNFQYLSTWHHNLDFCPQKIY